MLRHRRAGLLSRVIEEHGARALAVRCDVTRAEEVKAALAMTSETFGRLDFAFNNAGFEPSKPAPTAEYDNEEWERIIDINLRGVFLCMKHEIPLILNHGGGGAIVNTSSGAGNIGSRLDGWALLRKSLQPLALTKH
ncbi:MAG: SDR family oxidoreductase [Pirellulaceae bacterium]